MNAITILNATNRKDNKTRAVSLVFNQTIKKYHPNVLYYSMEDLPFDFLSDTYNNNNAQINKVIDEFIAPASKFVIIAPEYNGSFPGVFKLFLDAINPHFFKGKKAALAGVASGRAGNLRGLDHLTSILHHLQVVVMPQKTYISQMDKYVTDDSISDQTILKNIDNHVVKFLEF